MKVSQVQGKSISSPRGPQGNNKLLSITYESKKTVFFSLREISILRELEHPNIVKLIDVIMDEKKLYLVFEFLFMDLKKYIDEQKYQKNRIDVELTRSYMYQMLQVNSFVFDYPNHSFRLSISVMLDE